MNERSDTPSRSHLTVTAVAIALALIAIAVSINWPQKSDGPEGKPHLILITADTLRRDRLGSYGSSGSITPVLDRLARGSYEFRNFVSASNNTSVTFSSMHTGAYMRSHKVQGLSYMGYQLDPAFDTLAESLRDAGYITLAAVSARVVDGVASGFTQGFDAYVDCGSEYAKQPAAITNDKLLAALDTALEEDASGAPVFVWAHYFDPHWPYEPPSPHRELYLDRPAVDYFGGEEPELPDSTKDWDLTEEQREFFRLQYDGETRRMDAEIGRLLDALGERGLLENAVVVFTADHGENLGERGFFANHQRLFHEVSEPPLLVRVPGQEQGRLVETAAQTVDVLPTLLDFAGVKTLPEQVDGQSLLPWLRDDASADDVRTLFSEGAYQKEKIVRRGDFKLAYRLQPHVPTEASFELYDVEADPAERTELSESHPDVRRELEEELHEFLGQVPIRVKVTCLDGQAHTVRGILRPLKSSIVSVTAMGLEADDRHGEDRGTLEMNLRLDGEDTDELFVAADWTSALGVLFEVDGKPLPLEALRLAEDASPERSIYRHLLYLDDASPAPVPRGDSPIVEIRREDRGDHHRLPLRFERPAGSEGGPFELRVYGAAGIRVEEARPAGGVLVERSEDRLVVRVAGRSAELVLVVPAGPGFLVTDLRIGKRPIDPGDVALEGGLRTAPGVAFPSVLYSPRVRLARAGEGGGQSPDPSRTPVLVEISSPFLDGPSGSGKSLLDVDPASLDPKVRKQLEELGYLPTSGNQQN